MYISSKSMGVPLPIFYNEDGSEILDYDVMMHISDLYRKHGANIWYKWDAKDLLPEGYKNEKSPNGLFEKKWIQWMFGLTQDQLIQAS